jgi:hypothetical protein
MQRSLQAGLAGSLILTSLASGQIAFQGSTSYAAPQRPGGICACDLDGDGDMDLAVVTDNQSKLSLFYNQGAGTYMGPINVFLGSGTSPNSVAAADMDGDGDMDLVVSMKDQNSVRTVLNTGAGFMLGANTPTGGFEPRDIATGDLNGDGMPDVVTSNRDSNNISVLLNGGGTLASGMTFATGAEPRFLALGDLNGDGNLDLAVAAHDDRLVNVFMGTGTGGFGPATSLFVGSNLRPDGLAMGDLDGDGDLDLVTTTSSNTQNFVSSFMNAGGALSGPTHSPAGGLEPGDVLVADFDGDGMLDAATATKLSNSVTVLPGIGAGSFGAAIALAAGSEPGNLVSADMDGNGTPDLAVTNKLSNNMLTYMNDSVGGPGGVGSAYCQSLPNSSGAAATISASGSATVASNNFILQAASLPAGQLGYFLMSTTQGFAPGFGGSQGILCLGAPIVRLNQAVLSASPMGTVSLPINLSNLPNGMSISAGQTWNFQYWSRDLNPMPTSNTTHGVQVSFL